MVILNHWLLNGQDQDIRLVTKIKPYCYYLWKLKTISNNRNIYVLIWLAYIQLRRFSHASLKVWFVTKKCKHKYFSTGSHSLIKIVDLEEKETLHSFQNQSTYLLDAVMGSYGYLLFCNRWHLPNESPKKFHCYCKGFLQRRVEQTCILFNVVSMCNHKLTQNIFFLLLVSAHRRPLLKGGVPAARLLFSTKQIPLPLLL